MPNELDWTGTPQSAPLGQDGAVMQDDAKELCERLEASMLYDVDETYTSLPYEAAAIITRLSAENEALVKELNHAKDALAQANGCGFGRDEP